MDHDDTTEMSELSNLPSLNVPQTQKDHEIKTDEAEMSDLEFFKELSPEKTTKQDSKKRKAQMSKSPSRPTKKQKPNPQEADIQNTQKPCCSTEVEIRHKRPDGLFQSDAFQVFLFFLFSLASAFKMGKTNIVHILTL